VDGLFFFLLSVFLFLDPEQPSSGLKVASLAPWSDSQPSTQVNAKGRQKEEKPGNRAKRDT